MTFTNSAPGRFDRVSDEQALAMAVREGGWGHVIPLAVLVIVVWVAALSGPKRLKALFSRWV